jgi:hypothetical protein
MDLDSIYPNNDIRNFLLINQKQDGPKIVNLKFLGFNSFPVCRRLCLRA